MGYESRLYVINRIEHELPNGEKWVIGEEIGKINMCCMEMCFVDLFDTNIDYKIIADDHNTEITKDEYGSDLQAAPIQRVIDWLEKYMADGAIYRRLKPLLGFLKGFDQSEWNYLEVVHYGE